jgi:type VI secretion system protein ImpL
MIMAAAKVSKLRAILIVLAWLLLGLFIWFAGPYFAFADWHPLESAIARVITISVLIIVWLLVLLLRRAAAERKSEALLGEVAKQPDPVEASSPDAPVLRERFAEAVHLLKESSRGKQSLYALPWYIIVGAPGSGKTTLLVNSGLRMPLAQRLGGPTVAGVGGTRNCDWLFTDDAVFIDTAGRYTTQDSDAAADASGWKEFLALLQKYRRRRPLNGVILAISALDLLTLQPTEREQHIAAARRRLEELNQELRIELPVYVLITKFDLLGGFNEYFDDLGVEGRAQIWGVTFPYEATLSGDAIRAFPNELDLLVERLNARVLDRVEAEHDARRRGVIFGFPQQVSALRPLLVNYIAEVFTQSRFERRALLRGVYFTSGTQEGTPIDRLMSSAGRALGLGSDVIASAAGGRGKAYFIANLLKVLLLGESGLAGVNRRLEVKKAALQLGAYIAIAVLTTFLLVGFFVSLGRNQKYLAEMNAQTAQLAEVPVPASDAQLDSVVPRLDAFSRLFESADRYHDGAPFWMRFGLFQGHAVSAAAHDAYMRELDGVLLPRVAAQLRQRLIESSTAPDQLYEYLKAYLMLGQPEHLDKPQLTAIADLEFMRAYPTDPDTRQGVSKHLRALLDGEDKLRALSTDQLLVDQARNAIRQASLARLMYSRLKLNYAGDTEHALRLDVAAGLGADQVFQRKSGASLADPVPSLYTKAVFKEVSTTGTAELVKQFIADMWVLGGDSSALRQSAQLSQDMLQVYEKDYAEQWDRILADFQLRSFPTVEATTAALGILGAPTSPLRGFLQTIDTQTHLVPGPGEAPQGAMANAQQGLADRLRKLMNAGGKAMGVAPPSAPPGSFVTEHFASLHQSMAGPPGSAPVDRVLTTIGQLQQQLLSVGNAAGERSPLEVIAQSGRGDLVKNLQSQAGLLPPAIGAMVSEVGGHSEGVTFTQARGELQTRFQQTVVEDCNAVVRGRYPFTPGSSLDVPPADFGRIFGYGGLFETFFKDNLAALVDTTRRPWAWRAGADGATLGVSTAMLREFEAAQQIRESFFRPGAQLPELHFTVIPVSLDAAATRFILEVDGQSFEYRHGPQTSRPASWPGPNPGAAAASFEDRAGGHPNVSFQGPWALFRVLDAAHLEATTDTRFNMTFAMGGHSALYALEADSIRNPFSQRQLRAFHCSP